MEDDVDNLSRQPTYEELLRTLKYIARYRNHDFQNMRDPWKWCNEFTTVADDCLKGKRVFV